ncbi:MAG: hypothetical protein Alpg2KO_00100 [Alphaproteobacteria bacterium]
MMIQPPINYTEDRKNAIKRAHWDTRETHWVELANNKGFALVTTGKEVARDRVLAVVEPVESRPRHGYATVRQWRCRVFGFLGRGHFEKKAQTRAEVTRSECTLAFKWVMEQVHINHADSVWNAHAERPIALKHIRDLGLEVGRTKAIPPKA